MQSLISANQKSVTETKMVDSSNGYVPFYGNEPSLPELGIQFQKISPYIATTVPHNSSITFKLPPGSGFMYDASLGFTCEYTIAADDAVNAPIGINMIRSIEWLSNGQPIVYKTGHAIWAQITKWTNIPYQQHTFRYAKMLVPATEIVAAAGQATFLTYCPLFESFLTQVEKSLLLSKIADLQLRVTFNSVAECGLRTPAGITTIAPVLYVQTYQPKLSVMQEMLTNDWSKRLVMQAVNTYTEVSALVSGNAAAVTSTRYTLTVPFLVFKSHFFIRGITATATTGLANVRINNITMNLNGTTFLDSMPNSRMASCAAKNNTANVNVGTPASLAQLEYGTDIVTLDWGVLCGRGQNSGTAFFQELQGTSVTVNYTDVGDQTAAAGFRLYVVHEYFNTLAYEPSSGGGTLSVDSNN